MGSVRILIADDHELFRRGLRSLLATRPEWEVCDEAVNGRDAVEKARHLKPDVIVMDITMPVMNGLEATRLIRQEVPESEVLIVSQHDPAQMMKPALDAGARAYVTKSQVARDLLAAVEVVSRHVSLERSREKKPGSGSFASGQPPSKRDIEPGRTLGDSRDGERRIRLAQSAAEFGTWEWNPLDNGSSLSSELHAMFGTKAEDPNHAEMWLSRIFPEDKPVVEAALHSASQLGFIEFEYRYQHPKQGLRWFYCKGRRISGGDADPHMFGVVLDFTLRKKSEEELRKAHEQLELRVKERTADLVAAEESLRALTARLLQAQDEERRRLARELHDSAGQLLAALNMNLVPIQEEAEKLGPKFVRSVEESIQLVEQLSKELRTISHLLHPPMLDEAGLEFALQWYVEGFAERSKIDVNFELAPDLGRLPREVETTIFRLVQECLTNIHRHAESSVAHIRLMRDEQEVCLEVRDKGKGMPAGRLGASGPSKAGVGIQGMRERVRQLSGKLEIRTGSAGTAVLARLPIRKAAGQAAAGESRL
jgi:signal transduction histidine kinase/CheY-like chemotaxis protein